MGCDWMKEDKAFYLSMVHDFKSKALDELTWLSTHLDQWESDGEEVAAEDSRRCFDCVHRLKGTAGTLGLDNLLGPLRQLESLFFAASEGRIPLTRRLFKGLAEVVVLLKSIVEGIEPERLQAQPVDSVTLKSFKENVL